MEIPKPQPNDIPSRKDHMADFAYQAGIRNKNRPLKDKLLGRKKLASTDIAHEWANMMNNRFDQLVVEGLYDQAMAFVQKDFRNRLSKEKIERLEAFIAKSPEMRQAFDEGNFAPYFIKMTRGRADNPTSLRLFAQNACLNGYTTETVDTFYEEPTIRAVLRDELIRLAARHTSADKRNRFLDEYVRNRVISSEEMAIIESAVPKQIKIDHVTRALFPDIAVKRLQPHEHDIEELAESVRDFKGSTFRSLADIPSIRQHSARGTEIPTDLQSKLLAIYDENYSEEKGYSPEFRQTIFDNMRRAFGNDQARFYIAEKDSEVLTFLCFEDEPSDNPGSRPHKHLGFFNVDPDLQGSSIGSIFFSDIIKREGRDAVISATADPNLPISSYYIEKQDFVASGFKDLADKLLLSIERDTDIVRQLKSKRLESLSEAEIASLIDDGSLAMKTVDASSPLTFPEGDGWLLTRVIDDAEGGSATAVFEKRPIHDAATTIVA